MTLKDIFTTEKGKEPYQGDSDVSVTASWGMSSYTARGTKDAGYCGGNPNVLLPKLHAVYTQLVLYYKQHEQEQNNRKIKVKQEISGLESKNANIEEQIVNEQKKLVHEESKIGKITEEIENIKKNPEIISGDTFVKASFWIGFVIILFLTVYLFVFYSSAAYSAFFKDFTPDDTKITQAIFDAQAVGKAWADGFTELIFILAIPAVFLGLGFLIHKFSEEKGFIKYLKIFALVAVTFVFDFIIAYAIVKEIYNIAIGGIFQEMPPMSIEMAFQEVNFWIIIFAGFVVYIIWGLVFSFTMHEYEKMDKVRYAIKTREKKIVDYKAECKNIKAKIATLQTEKTTARGEIDKLNILLAGSVLYFDDVSGGINNYFSGWVGYLESTRSPIANIHECTQIKDKFILDLKSSIFIK